MSHFVSEHICVGGKNVISLKIYFALPTLFWSQVRQMQHSFCIYFLQDIYHTSLQINHNGPMEGDIYCINSWNYCQAIELDPAAEC